MEKAQAKLEFKAIEIMCKVVNGQRLKDLAELKLWNNRKGSVLMERYLTRQKPDCREQFEKLKEDILKQSVDFPSLADHDRRRAHTLEQNGVLYGMIREARTHGISIVKIPPSLRPNFHPPKESTKELVRELHGIMKSYVKDERRVCPIHEMIDWGKPLYSTIGHLQEWNGDKAQLLMKRYQKRLKMNKEIYPELIWPDLQLTISDHQKEWGNVIDDEDPTPTFGSVHPSEHQGSEEKEWYDQTSAC